MARVSRTRSRTLRGPGIGTIVRTPIPLSNPTVTSFNMGEERCTDWVGAPWVDSPFSHDRGVAPRVTLNGTRTQSGLTYQSIDVPLDNSPLNYLVKPWFYSTFTRTIPPGLAAMAVANANPNRPDVDLPVSIAELRELPSLLRDAAGIAHGVVNRARAPAKANLMAQFGVLPILSDVVTLFDFAKRVDARETYLRELSAGDKRIKRKLLVENWGVIVPNLIPFSSNADNQTSTNKCTVTADVTRTFWYTMRASLLDVLSERDLQDLAPQLLLGMSTVTAKQLWELVPWTWLIDWFSNTGSILAAYRGGLRWQWSALNIMYRTDYRMSVSFPNIRPGFTISPVVPTSHAVSHNRIQPTVSIYPTWRIPYLTGRQWSILSSLLILRL